jgi:hypothetical protein
MPLTTPRRRALNNLVSNGDFDYAPTFTAATNAAGTRWVDGTAAGSTTNDIYKWGVNPSGATVNASFDGTTRHGNSLYSMKLVLAATGTFIELNRYRVDNDANHKLYGVPVLPSTSYTLTGWMKTLYTSGDSSDGAYLKVSEFNGAGTAVATNVGTKVKTTTDWTRYSITFTTNANTRYVSVGANLYGQTGTGTLLMTAWIDDLSFGPTTALTRTAA